MPLSFGEESDRRAAEAWQHGVVLVDRSHWGRLRLSGDGRKEFLHGQTTADINSLKAGQFCESVRFCSHTSRTGAVSCALCSVCKAVEREPACLYLQRFCHIILAPNWRSSGRSTVPHSVSACRHSARQPVAQ